MKLTLKKWAMIGAAIIVAAILVQIVIKIVKSNTKVAETIVTVGAVKLVSSDVAETISIQGIAEGDPQVRVYSQVPGKFDSNAVTDGDTVIRDQAISYINRDQVGFNFQLAPVKAPISGIVTKLYYADKGAAVNPMYPIAEVANPEKIKVVLSMGEEELGKIAKGQKVYLKAAYKADAVIEGKVFSVTPFVDRDTMAGTVIVKGDNKEKILHPGMSVNVEIETNVRKGFLVAEKAVLMGEGKTYVFVNESNKAKRIDVELGYSKGEFVEIKGPLTEGMEIITEGNFKLSDNAAIVCEVK